MSIIDNRIKKIDDNEEKVREAEKMFKQYWLFLNYAKQ